ncbi:U2 snRNP auxilliary factor, partial [Striga asiatica]
MSESEKNWQHDLIKTEHLMSPTHPPGPSRHRHRHRHRDSDRDRDRDRDRDPDRDRDRDRHRRRHQRSPPEKKQKQSRQQNTSVAVTDCSDLCLAFAEGGKFTELILSHHSSGVILNLRSLVTSSETPMYSWGVSCARDSMDLKVVVYIPADPRTGVNVDEFHVLTIGEGEDDDDESWRVVQAEPRVFKYKPVLITDGFMHWVLHDDRLLTDD